MAASFPVKDRAWPVVSVSVAPTSAVLLALLLLCACTEPDAATPDQLIRTDEAFSQLSEEQGLAHAFHAYMAEDGLVLPRSAPPFGRDLFARMMGRDGDGTSLSWEVTYADIAASGDLGYTYGTYTQVDRDSTGESRTLTGHYVTIWKRQPDGGWKFVFDTGNQLPPEPEPAVGEGQVHDAHAAPGAE